MKSICISVLFVFYNQIEMKAKHGAKMKHIEKLVDVIVNLYEYGNIFTGSSEFDLNKTGSCNKLC